MKNEDLDEKNESELDTDQEVIVTNLELEKPTPIEKKIWPKRFWEWLGKNSTQIQGISIALTVIVTCFLAFYAFRSWNELKRQRELAHKQFVIANEPSIEIYINNKFEFKDEIGFIIWDLVNYGGPVQDILTKTVIIYFDKSDLKNARIIGAINRQNKRDRLIRNMKMDVYSTIYKPATIEWLKEAIKTSDQLFIYAQAEFNIPEELTLSGTRKYDKTFKIERWVQGYQKFVNVNPDDYDTIISLIKEKGLLESPDNKDEEATARE
jgi:hypothetical protein